MDDIRIFSNDMAPLEKGFSLFPDFLGTRKLQVESLTTQKRDGGPKSLKSRAKAPFKRIQNPILRIRTKFTG